MRSRFVRRFTKKRIAEPLTKGAENPIVRLKITLDTLGDFQKSVRDPLIEASTAALILFVLNPLLPNINTWIVITLIIIIAVVIGTLALTLMLWKEGNRVLRGKQRTRT